MEEVGDGGGGNEGRMCAKRFFSVVDRDRYGRIVRPTEKRLHSLGGEIDNLDERIPKNRKNKNKRRKGCFLRINLIKTSLHMFTQMTILRPFESQKHKNTEYNRSHFVNGL